MNSCKKNVLAPDENNLENPWMSLRNSMKGKNGIYEISVEIKDQVLALLESDGFSWKERIDWCQSPEDFRKLFILLCIPADQWKSSNWMSSEAKRSPNEGGIGRPLAGLAYAIKQRFELYSNFVAWMEGREKPAPSLRERVSQCKHREEYLTLFKDLGIPGEEWKNSRWLERTSALPPTEGGINLKLAHLVQYIRSKPEFGSFPQFVAWMEGKEKPDEYITVRVRACNAPLDFFQLFIDLGIPNEMWEDTTWLLKIAQLPTEQGGIGKGMNVIVNAIRKDDRFKQYKKFVAWMYGKDSPDPSIAEQVRGCTTKEDFISLFQELNIPEEKWRSYSWLVNTAKLPASESGINRSMAGLVYAISAKFNGYSKFVSWMDGKPEPTMSWAKKVQSCSNQEDFISLFRESGIPGDEWKNCNWLTLEAKKPVAEGGIGKNLSGLSNALRLDSRFKSHVVFVAWMEGKEFEKATSWNQVVKNCKTRDDFRGLFDSYNIPVDKWKVAKWFITESAKPIEKGGVGKSLSGLQKAIGQDIRFNTYPRFIEWMEGGELEKDYIKVSRKQFASKIKECLTPQDFLNYFRELLIPEDNWRSARWLSNTSHDAEKTLHGNLSGLPGAISKDSRFKSHRVFVAWMDGKSERPLSNREAVIKCQTREDFLQYFLNLGIPKEKWRDGNWLREVAQLPPEQGGISKKGLTSLPQVIGDDTRFGSFPNFIAWMDGKEKADDYLTDLIRNCRTKEDFLKIFADLEIPEDKWKDGQWLREDAILPVEQGGIGKGLSGVNKVIVNDARFMSHRKFLAWMEGSEELDNEILANTFRTCATREDYLRLFKELGIPGGKWRSYNWLVRTAALSVEKGGILKPLEGMILAIREKFDSYKGFIRWMDDDVENKETWNDRISKLKTPADFHTFFRDLGVIEEQWRNSSWLNTKAVLSKEEGGIGIPLQGLTISIHRRFGGYKKFVAWMDGKDRPDLTHKERIAICKTPEDFLRLFREFRIPENAWESQVWFHKIAKLPIEQGGIGRNMSGFLMTIKNDGRWETYQNFVSWMKGNARPIFSYPRMISNCQSKDDFLSLLHDLGVPEGKWRDGVWMSKISGLPIEEGGINKSMTGFCAAIRADIRFEGYPQFVSWMNGELESHESIPSRIRKCKDRQDYHLFFQQVGIPGNKWRNTNWLRNIAPLSTEKGGVGKTFHSIPVAIRSEKGFKTYRHFVAWMDGKENPDLSFRQKVKECINRDDFLHWFDELRIPQNKWRSTKWLCDIAKLPPTEGGIGRKLAGVPQAILDDGRFLTFKHFKDWMDGVPLEGISSKEQAIELLNMEARRLSIPMEQLLQPEVIQQYISQSSILRHVVAYFDSSQKA